MFQTEDERIDKECALREKWDVVLCLAGAEEAFFNGDEPALIIAVEKALKQMG